MKEKRFCIGVDLMGADIAPESIVCAIAELSPDIFQDTQFVLFTTREFSSEKLTDLPISFYPCVDVIQMDDDPVQAVKRKKESTLVCGVKELANKKLDAFISCANTGALVLASYLHLNLLQGVHKPALVAEVPTATGSCVVLDVGATPKCGEKELVQFAYLGSLYSSCMRQQGVPKVGLLNIGDESGKGTDELHRANIELSKSIEAPFSFVGNIEPRHVFAGQVDVVVTSGFTGNIFLKTAEAVAEHLLKQRPRLDDLRALYSQDDAPGAFLLGVNGCVCKCHGLATGPAIQKAILSTRTFLQKDLIGYIERFLSK